MFKKRVQDRICLARVGRKVLTMETDGKTLNLPNKYRQKRRVVRASDACSFSPCPAIHLLVAVFLPSNTSPQCHIPPARARIKHKSPQTAFMIRQHWFSRPHPAFAPPPVRDRVRSAVFMTNANVQDVCYY